MEKRTIDPWKWGVYTNSVQAVEVCQPAGTLYCSGQAAIDETGAPSAADMRSQLTLTLKNLEQLIAESGYELSGIVRLNVFTTSTSDFFASCGDLYAEWLRKNGIRQCTSFIEVRGLYATLNVELEATAVR